MFKQLAIFQSKSSPRTPRRGTSRSHFFLKILKAVKRKMEPYLQGKIVKVTADFSSESMEARMG